ncbi:MAG: hypothetical protein ACOX64_00635 [Candidatus Merdivicinus sp.]|jgi:hypothetical protein
MRSFYQTIVLGASMEGLGYAWAQPDTLILESSEMLAPEYTAAFHPLCGDFSREEGPLTDSLRKNGVLSRDGALDFLALSTGLYRFAGENSLPILLLAKTVEIRRSEHGTEVEFYTNQGLCTIQGTHLLDTRPKKPLRRTYNVLCHRPSAGFAERLKEQFPLGVEIVPSFRKDECVIRFAVTKEAGISDARRMVTEGWKVAFPDGGSKITAAAFDLDCLELGANPLAAFQHGMQCGKEGRI